MRLAECTPEGVLGLTPSFCTKAAWNWAESRNQKHASPLLAPHWLPQSRVESSSLFPDFFPLLDSCGGQLEAESAPLLFQAAPGLMQRLQEWGQRSVDSIPLHSMLCAPCSHTPFSFFVKQRHTAPFLHITKKVWLWLLWKGVGNKEKEEEVKVES